MKNEKCLAPDRFGAVWGDLAPCFRGNGARCGECQLKQPADKLPDGVRENLEALIDDVLEPARVKLGKPIKVNSGYRCSVHNAKVGGVFNSQHMNGETADICCCDNSRLAEIILENGRYDQMIVYPTFIHVSWKRGGRNRKQVIWKV